MNNDNVIKNKIIFLKKVLDKLDKIFSQKIGYNIFFKYIRHSLKSDLIQTDNCKSQNKVLDENKNIPFRFWTMWWQGLEDAPLIVRKNIIRLQKEIGKDNIVIITKDNYKKYTNISNTILRKFNDKKITFTSWSDIVRFNILKNQGGYWIDSTVALSPKFWNYFYKINKKTFFSICNKNQNYHNISYSRWTIWFIGGSPNYDLFAYMDNFYKIYYSNHDISIDYFLTDDVISYYYLKKTIFQKYCNDMAEKWYTYFFNSKFDKPFKKEFMDKFNDKLEYSVQKLTYKFDQNLLLDKNSTIYYLLNTKWIEE